MLEYWTNIGLGGGVRGAPLCHKPVASFFCRVNRLVADNDVTMRVGLSKWFLPFVPLDF